MYFTTRLTAVKGAEDHRAKIWIVHKGTDGQIPLLVWDAEQSLLESSNLMLRMAR